MSNTGRPTKDLTPFRFQIEQWKDIDRMTINELIVRISAEFDISVSRATLYRYFKTWQSDQSSLSTNRAYTEDTEALRDRIKELYFNNVLNDKNILHQLQNEGFVVTLTGLQRIRRDLDILRRQTAEQKEVQLAKLRQIFKNDALLNTKLQTFGRTYLYTYIRQQDISLSRDDMYEAFRSFMPTNVTDRWNTMQYRRRGWTAPGPDFTWSIDAYDKLKAWGFGVYAAIDAYSRNIIWLYVGISANTSRSVLEQYLNVLQDRGTMPCVIRSDRGNETLLMAGAHFYLSQSYHNVRGNTQPIEFQDCWIFGKSTHNERIESWWHRLSEGRAKHWRAFFSRITAQGHFSADSIPDRIAILYLYMPLIRTELIEFVHLWNAHKIRKQRNRPHVISGQPWVLYNQPETQGAKKHALQVPHDQLRLLIELFDNDQIDIHAYLPEDTITICNQLLEGQVFPCDSPENPKLSIYLFLRAQLGEYILKGQQPTVRLLSAPTGGINRIRDYLATHDIDIESLNQEDSTLSYNEVN